MYHSSNNLDFSYDSMPQPPPQPQPHPSPSPRASQTSHRFARATRRRNKLLGRNAPKPEKNPVPILESPQPDPAAFVEEPRADAAGYALDSSPLEHYESKTQRSERIATALERIAKNAAFFGLSAEENACPSDTSPKTAVIPLIVDAITQHVRDPKVADQGLTTLRRLTVDPVCRRTIGECGGVEAIVEVMRAHSLRVRIQTQACLALANLAYKCPENKRAFMKCNGLAVIVAALSIHSKAEHVQAWGCFAIRNFTNGAIEGEQDASVTAGAVEVLVTALEQYPKSNVVQQQCMIALTNIAAASPLGMERLRSAGGVQAVIASMHNNIRSSQLSEIALSCAKVLVEEESNQKIFGHDGGIEAITMVLDEHRGHTAIAVRGCAAFRQLAFQRENRDLLGRCGSIRAIITAMMDTASSKAETAAVLLKALSNSTYDSLANKTLAGRLGAVEAALHLISPDTFQSNTGVVEDACRVLRNLADGVQLNHRLLIEKGGVVAVLEAAREHGTSSAGVAEHCVAIFVNLSANQSLAEQLKEGGKDFAAMARELQLAHPGNDRVYKQVADLLSILEPKVDDGEPVSTESVEWRESKSCTWRETATQISFEESLRSSKSLRKTFSKEGEQLTRLQRLRSLPLPKSKKSAF
ncbi:unnamed protein product [Chondrus crispus]|uniref:LRRK2 ARM repeat domain-containing protein n=1 Tax=Chondrus crispus TaxID=2769 RepID=R7QFR9_CHOCR|nr:unnamed protein product [Chondrus crispus]CDF37372.1 unnamed protein product [Chondrus crispus]|eukprot:XP_005717191.1 unnamed protein product [Chondrus crispus]